MRLRAIVAYFLLLDCPCFCARPSQKSERATEGVLLGFSTAGPNRDNHYAAQHLSTAWIVRDGSSARVEAILPFLVVPRANGFWRVWIESVCEMYGDKNEFRSIRNIVWSVPIDSTSQLTQGPGCPQRSQVQTQSNSNEEEFELTDGQRVDRYTDCLYSIRIVRFVSPNYISEAAEEANTEDCEARGGREATWSRVLAITSPEMTELEASGEGDSTTKVLSDFAEKDARDTENAFKQAFAMGQKSLEESGLNCPDADVDYEGWQIKRTDGAWTPWISQVLVLGNGSECSIDQPVPVHLPVSLVGNNRVVPDFSQLKKAIPELTDAFTSPHGDTTILIAGSRLLVFNVSEGKLGAKLLDADFPAGSTPVMEQWALGVRVKTWTQQVQQWKIHPPSAPIVSSRTRPTK